MSAVIHAFRPNRTLIENLEATFVGREHLLQDILVHLNRWQAGVSRQHYLLIGPRGIGKTNLLLLLENRINKSPELRKKWHPISLPEDLYGVTKVSDLLVESLKILVEKTNDHDAIGAYQRIQFDNNENRVVDLALDAFRRFHSAHKCGVLMMVENINRLLERDSWYQSDIRLLRKILIEEEWLMIVCTSPTFLKAVTEPEEPLFEFFTSKVLSELTFDEQQSLLHKLASLSGDNGFQNYLIKYQSRLQALYHFTGGNPRLAIMLYELVANQNITEVKTELDLLLDKLTPFYQNRMKDLPAEQGKLLEAMALLPEGCTPTELAQQTRTPAKNVRALMARLEKAGYIRKEERRLKKTVYILPERFFRIWHQMNHSRAARGRIQYLLEFFSSWYATREERDHIWNELTERFQEGLVAGDESRTGDIAEYMEYIAAVSKGSERFEREFDRLRKTIDLSSENSIIAELSRLDEEHQKDGQYFIHKGYFLANDLRWHQAAHDAFKRAIELKQDDIIAHFNRAVTLDKMGRERKARQAYLDTASFLSKSRGMDAIEEVEDILVNIIDSDADSRIVKMGAYILGRTAKKAIAARIVAILEKAKESWRRQHCATALGLLRAKEAIDPLISHLSDEANHVRGSAATALGQIGSERAVPSLIVMLHDEDRITRASAETALGRIGSEQAVPSLIEMFDDEDRITRASAATALGRIGSEQAVPSLIEMLHDEDRITRASAATALGQIGLEQAVEPLIECLHDEANNVRGSATTALGRIGSEQAVPSLIEMLHDEDRITRASAATALGQIGLEQAVEPLIECLQDEANNVRGSAAAALGRLGSEQAIGPLIRCLQDEANNVRGSAAAALGRLGSEQAIEPLIRCLQDKANDVRGSSAIALGRLCAITPVPNILQVIDTLLDLQKDILPHKILSSMRQLLQSSFRIGDLKTVRDSLEIVKSKLSDADEFCVPYLAAVEYLESNRNPAIIERQHLEMREAILLLVNAFDEGYEQNNVKIAVTL
jgi:HEAT repeat protein/DNA-binding MarR family transcriptional regulator